MKLATRRLIDASATLPAADRALINLWTQRGLDDATMARMTGVDPATIARRRDRIVADLSTELGLPPADVAAALTAIAVSATEALATKAAAGDPAGETFAAPPPGPAPGNGDSSRVDDSSPAIEASTTAPAASAGPLPMPGSQANVEPEKRQPESRPQPETTASDARARRRPALWLSAALAGIIIIAIVAIAAASGSGTGHRTASVTLPASATAPAATASVASVSPSGPRTFSPLPGGVAGASGSVAVAPGSGGTQRLLVHVTGLPPAGRDHYAVWLYNSIIDSVALGALRRNGTGRFTLPAAGTRFASIDISRQTRRMRQPSGVSVLRAANPLAGAPH